MFFVILMLNPMCFFVFFLFAFRFLCFSTFSFSACRFFLRFSLIVIQCFCYCSVYVCSCDSYLGASLLLLLLSFASFCVSTASPVSLFPYVVSFLLSFACASSALSCLAAFRSVFLTVVFMCASVSYIAAGNLNILCLEEPPKTPQRHPQKP